MIVLLSRLPEDKIFSKQRELDFIVESTDIYIYDYLNAIKYFCLISQNDNVINFFHNIFIISWYFITIKTFY